MNTTTEPSNVIPQNPFVLGSSGGHDSRNTIFKCGFGGGSNGESSCQVKFSGKDWLLTTVNDIYGRALDQYYSVELKSNEKSELFFQDMVPMPQDGVACLSFRYKKYLKGEQIIFFFVVNLTFTRFLRNY